MYILDSVYWLPLPFRMEVLKQMVAGCRLGGQGGRTQIGGGWNGGGAGGRTHTGCGCIGHGRGGLTTIGGG